MAIILFSVPHTGTRFAAKFLEAIHAKYRQYHTEATERVEEHIDSKYQPKIVFPMRDPLLCWMSHYIPYARSMDINRFDRIKNVAQNVADDYNLLTYIEELTPCVHLRLDTKDRPKELQKVADHVESTQPISNFTWENVGVSREVPSNYALFETVKQTLNPDEIEIIMETLFDVRKRYGYSCNGATG